ncbi:MAG: hypothetical protein R3F31_28050 [Verrucomicrobiales bacterium]
MHSKIVTAFVLLALSSVVQAGPDITEKSYDTVRIVSPQSKDLAKSSDRETIAFLLASMKRAESAGSNTYGLSLTSTIEFSSPDSRRPTGDGEPVLSEVSSWYVDLASGHFALVSPPKLVIYRFTKGDLAMLKKKLKIPAEQVGAGQPATAPESKSEGGDKPQTESEGRSR